MYRSSWGEQPGWTSGCPPASGRSWGTTSLLEIPWSASGGYLEALELLAGVLLLPQARVEDEQLGVSEPDLQLFDSSLQLLRQRPGERGQGRPRVLRDVQQGQPELLGARSRMLRQDGLRTNQRRETLETFSRTHHLPRPLTSASSHS